MGSMQYLSFLRRSHKIISSELVGLNLVVFKEPYEHPSLVIIPKMEAGTDLIEYAQLICKKFAVRFFDKENRVF
jgi:hypothetical protein